LRNWRPLVEFAGMDRGTAGRTWKSGEHALRSTLEQTCHAAAVLLRNLSSARPASKRICKAYIWFRGAALPGRLGVASPQRRQARNCR
jgi:hypothetical protein